MAYNIQNDFIKPMEKVISDAKPPLAAPVCCACGQAIQREVKVMAYDANLIYITVTGGTNVKCPKCFYVMKRMKVRGGLHFECQRCTLTWRLDT